MPVSFITETKKKSSVHSDLDSQNNSNSLLTLQGILSL